MHVQHIDIPITLPFFHPTSVVVVDDDPDFLQSFNFLVGDEIACKLYANPLDAVTHLESAAKLALPNSSYFFPFKESGGQSGGDHPNVGSTDRFIAFSPSKIRDLMFNAQRFEMPSVVVVDFDMPDIDGVEFCRRIKGLPFKKVILTGKADEKVAVQAFNEGLIDRFICKHSETVSEEIFSTLDQLQQDYFKDITASLSKALRVKPSETIDGPGFVDDPGFVNDPGFGKYFYDLCKREGCVEYYFSAVPQGVLMLDASGRMKFLLVRDLGFMRSHVQIAEDLQAPQELIDRLKTGREQPWFPTSHGYYDPEITNWQDYLYPADIIEGTVGWRCSLIDGVEALFDPEDQLQSFSLFRVNAGNGALQ